MNPTSFFSSKLNNKRRVMYKAVILMNENSISRIFSTVVDAERWLDSENNNLERTSYIQELDQDYKVKDWFYYTK